MANVAGSSNSWGTKFHEGSQPAWVILPRASLNSEKVNKKFSCLFTFSQLSAVCLLTYRAHKKCVLAYEVRQCKGDEHCRNLKIRNLNFPAKILKKIDFFQKVTRVTI